MEVIVLGCSGSFPARRGACSGYLVKAGGKNILVDCGNGVLARLQEYIPVEQLDAVLLTHLHFDHCADLPVLGYGLETKKALGQAISSLPVYLPHSPTEVAAILISNPIFQPTYIEENRSFQLADLWLNFRMMPHSVESYAISITDAGTDLSEPGKKIVFSGDTTGSPALIEAALHADLFVCESTLVDKGVLEPPPPHMTARQAAQTALEAGVKQLCLTHFWYEEDLQEILKVASQVFSSTCLAKPGLTLLV